MQEVGIEFRKVGLQLPNGHWILNNIALRLERGTTTALLGRSGSGKTTLLRLVNRLTSPSIGDVLVEGRPNADYELTELRRRIGYVIQETPVNHLSRKRRPDCSARLL